MPFRIMSPHIHRRPLIGVTGPDQGGLAAWCFTWYAIRRAGGRAKRITPRRPCTMKELSGLVIGGGADISPDFYDPNKTPETTTEVVQAIEHQRGLFRSSITWLLYPLLYVIRRIFTTKVGHYGDPARDDLELKLLDEALQLNRPVLGICRGCQLINVHLGGNLHRDIRNFYVAPPHITTVFPRKEIEICPQTRLREILGVSSCQVNALHYQAIDRVGQGLAISARETNPNIIQAIEYPGRFVIGVQWHPEYLFREQRQRELFSALVQSAATVILE